MNTSSLSEQKFMNRLTAIIETNLDNEKFGVAELAKELGMSRSNLHRKVKTITKTTAVQFIRQVRLKAALEMLKDSSFTVSEVTYKTGFSSPSYFVKCFHEYFGFPPGEVKYRDFNEPVISGVPANKKNKIKLSWVFTFLLLSIILFIAFNNYISTKDDKKLSIAVLPFKDDSPEEGNSYIVNGIMEEIINKLEKIEDFDVVSRTSAENYRNTNKNIKTIARELGVNYILEGSGQKIGDKIKLSIQLIDSKSDMHLWSKPFIKEVIFENIFELYEEVALSVAEELKSNLTPTEKEQIKKLPTNNITAYNLYLRGLDHLSILNFSRNSDDMFEAKRLFEQAVKLDTTFADAYRQLGHIYINTFSNFPNLDVSNWALELGKTMINKALYFDANQNVLAMQITYYLKKGMFKEAENLLKNSYSDKEKDYNYYEYAFNLYLRNDNSKALESFYKFMQLKPEVFIVSPQMWLRLCSLFNSTGYPQIGEKYAERLLIQASDTVLYYYLLAEGQLWQGNIRNSVDYALKGHEIDKPLFSPNTPGFILIYCNLFLRDHSNSQELLQYAENGYAKFKYPVVPDISLGYTYLQKKIVEKADYHFNGVEKRSLKEIDLNLPIAQKFDSHFNLALIYSLRGEKTKALEYLQRIKEKESVGIWSITQLNYHPAFDNIRDESEFAEISRDAEAKYQIEHKRIGKIIDKFEGNKLNE